VNAYAVYKLCAIFCMLGGAIVNYYMGVGNSLYMLLLALYFQLNAMEARYAEKEQVQA
jgi:hypothetical protein